MMLVKNNLKSTRPALFVSLATLCIGGGALLPNSAFAQFEPPVEALPLPVPPQGSTWVPASLKQGVSLVGVYGGMDYRHSMTFPQGETNAGSARWPEIYTEAGIQNMLTETLPLFNFIDQKFMHVRIAIDPLVCGQIVNGVYKFPDELSAPSPAMAALLDDVALCNDRNLAVILCLNPYWISPRHHQFKTTGIPIPGAPWATWVDLDSSGRYKGAWGYPRPTSVNYWNPPNPYLGPWRKDFVTVWGNTQPPSANLVPSTHPLVRSWKGISDMIRLDGRFNSKQVFFQILDEPLVGFNQNTLTAAELFDDVYEDLDLRRGWWRAVQLKAIQTIWAQAPDYRVIATPTENMPHSYVETQTDLPNYNESLFPHYLQSEFSLTDFAAASKIIYAFNNYCPYEFAENPGLPTDPRWFYVNKFYPGDSQFNPLLNWPARDDYRPPVASPHIVNNPYHRNRVEQYMLLMNQWRKKEWPIPSQKSNPIMMTGFGTKYVVLTTGATNVDTGHTHVDSGTLQDVLTFFPGESDPLPLYNAWHDRMRARWVYDTRTLAENLKFGWTHFSATGAFRSINLEDFAWNSSSLPGTIPPPATEPEFMPDYEDALFGPVRP